MISSYCGGLLGVAHERPAVLRSAADIRLIIEDLELALELIKLVLLLRIRLLCLRLCVEERVGRGAGRVNIRLLHQRFCRETERFERARVFDKREVVRRLRLPAFAGKERVMPSWPIVCCASTSVFCPCLSRVIEVFGMRIVAA